jgi:hypothetical protein
VYKVEEKLYLGVREQKKVEYRWSSAQWHRSVLALQEMRKDDVTPACLHRSYQKLNFRGIYLGFTAEVVARF